MPGKKNRTFVQIDKTLTKIFLCTRGEHALTHQSVSDDPSYWAAVSLKEIKKKAPALTNIQ